MKVAVCNLASIALNRFVTAQGEFDFKTLFDVTKVDIVCILPASNHSPPPPPPPPPQVVTRNLNKIIDINFYPVPEV